MESEKHMFTPNQVSENLPRSKQMQMAQTKGKKHPAELSPSQTPKSISCKTQTDRKPGFTNSGTHANT